MKAYRSPLSISILYWLFNIASIFMALIVVAAIFFNVLLYTNFLGDDLQLHTRFPALIDIEQKGVFEKGNFVTEIEFVDAQAQVHFIDTPKHIAKRIAIAVIFVALLAFLISWAIRTVMKNVHKGEIFVRENVTWMHRLAMLIAVFWLFSQAYFWWFQLYLLKGIQMKGVSFKTEIDFLNESLLLALAIWVIAHIFKVGVRLQEESALTI